MAQNNNFQASNLEEVKPTTTYLQPNYGYQTLPQAPITSSQYLGSVSVQGAQPAIKGESRIEYVPYEKSVIEYEAVPRTEYVAREKKVVDHYAVEYQTEYVPQVFHDRYVEYIPQERFVERVEYTPVERQIVHQPQQEVVQQEVVQTVQPVQYQTVQVPQPVQYQTVSQVQVTPNLAQSYVAPAQYVYQSGAPVQYSYQPAGAIASQLVRSNIAVPTPVAAAATPAANQVASPQAAAPAQKKFQQRPNHGGEAEPGFLDMLFGYPGNHN